MSISREVERRAHDLARLAAGDTVMHVTPDEKKVLDNATGYGAVRAILTPWGIVSLAVRSPEPTPAELVAQWRDRAENDYRHRRDNGYAYKLMKGCADALEASLAAQERREHPRSTVDL